MTPRRTADSSRLEYALRYLALGWTPLALCGPECRVHHRKRCPTPGKVPLGQWKWLQTKKPSEWDVRRWWRDAPASNVGLIMGPASGLVAVDIDGNERGMALLEARSRGEVGDALCFSTARGIRLLYAFDPRVSNATVEEGGGRLEVLATGRQTVAPPSLHETGHVYTWLGPWENPTPAPAPTWLIDICRAHAHKSGTGSGWRPAQGELIGEGRRNTTAFELACAVRRWGFTRDEILVVLDVLNERCVPPLDTEELFTIADKVERRYSPL